MRRPRLRRTSPGTRRPDPGVPTRAGPIGPESGAADRGPGGHPRPAGPGSLRRSAGFRRWRRKLGEVVSEVYQQAAEDNVFFLASGLTFSLLLAAIPFLLVLLSVASLFLAPQLDQPRSAVLDALWRIVPVSDVGVRQWVSEQLREVVASAGSIGLVSGLLFVWFATRLFGALRTALAEVFDVRETPGVVAGKVIDVEMVVVSTLLLSLNIGITSGLNTLGARGLEWLGLGSGLPGAALGFATAFFFVYLMFLLIYKFVTPSPPPWPVAAVAALVASIGFEALKALFSLYVATFADFGRVFFGVATVIVLVMSVYYASAIFIIGGEVGQIYELRRTFRAQRETFERP